MILMWIGEADTIFNRYPLGINGLGEVIDKNAVVNLVKSRLASQVDATRLSSFLDKVWGKYRVTTVNPNLDADQQKAIEDDVYGMGLSVYFWNPTEGGVVGDAIRSLQGYYIVPIALAQQQVAVQKAPPKSPAPTIQTPVLTAQQVVQPTKTAQPKPTPAVIAPTETQTQQAQAAGISPLILALAQQQPAAKRQNTSQVIEDIKAGKYNHLLSAQASAKKGSGWVIPVLLIGAVGITVFVGVALGARYNARAPKR